MAASGNRVGSTRLAWSVVGVLLLTGCTLVPGWTTTGTPPASERAVGPAVTGIRLPDGASPGGLAFSGDGALMVTEGSGNAIARVDAAGKVTQYRIPGSENSPGDIVAGPDGTMWFAGFELIGRLHADGRVTGWQQMSVGLPSALTTGPDGAIWYTSETVPPRITRVDAAGAFSSFQLPAGSGGLTMAGITSGPDGALWFTQSPMGEGPPDAIGRLLPDGRYARFSLPHPRSDPQRICVGPDGALWFTEYARYGIGRITTLGDISEFPLPPGTSPAGITAGTDGALWFTTDTRVGRITTSGQITFRPVPGSRGLGGILAAPDGTLWLADGQADTVWHFTPHS